MKKNKLLTGTLILAIGLSLVKPSFAEGEVKGLAENEHEFVALQKTFVIVIKAPGAIRTYEGKDRQAALNDAGKLIDELTAKYGKAQVSEDGKVLAFGGVGFDLPAEPSEKYLITIKAPGVIRTYEGKDRQAALNNAGKLIDELTAKYGKAQVSEDGKVLTFGVSKPDKPDKPDQPVEKYLITIKSPEGNYTYSGKTRQDALNKAAFIIDYLTGKYGQPRVSEDGKVISFGEDQALKKAKEEALARLDHYGSYLVDKDKKIAIEDINKAKTVEEVNKAQEQIDKWAMYEYRRYRFTEKRDVLEKELGDGLIDTEVAVDNATSFDEAKKILTAALDKAALIREKEQAKKDLKAYKDMPLFKERDLDKEIDEAKTVYQVRKLVSDIKEAVKEADSNFKSASDKNIELKILKVGQDDYLLRSTLEDKDVKFEIKVGNRSLYKVLKGYATALIDLEDEGLKSVQISEGKVLVFDNYSRLYYDKIDELNGDLLTEVVVQTGLGTFMKYARYIMALRNKDLYLKANFVNPDTLNEYSVSYHVFFTYIGD